MAKGNVHGLLYCKVHDEIVGCAHRDSSGGGARIYRHPSSKGCRCDVKTLQFKVVDSDHPTPYEFGLN